MIGVCCFDQSFDCQLGPELSPRIELRTALCLLRRQHQSQLFLYPRCWLCSCPTQAGSNPESITLLRRRRHRRENANLTQHKSSSLLLASASIDSGPNAHGERYSTIRRATTSNKAHWRRRDEGNPTGGRPRATHRACGSMLGLIQQEAT